MKHLNDGMMRRLIDDPLAAPADFRRHLETCGRCRARFEEIQRDAASAQDACAGPRQTPDPKRALSSVARRIREDEQRPDVSVPWLWGRNRQRVAAVAGAAALAVVLAATPVGSYAQKLTTIFEPTSVVALPVPTDGLSSLSGLSHIGTLNAPKATQTTDVPNLQAAEQAAGFSFSLPTSLPQGLGKPSFKVMPQGTLSFTFSESKAAAYTALHGGNLPPVPKALDGSTVYVNRKPAILAVYGTLPAKGATSLHDVFVDAETPVPTLTSTGVTVQEMENYVLSIPGLSPQLKQEIQSIAHPERTLPIPIPTQSVTSTPVTINGSQGLLVKDKNLPFAAVIWTQGSMMHVVGGTLDVSQLETIARGMQ